VPSDQRAGAHSRRRTLLFKGLALPRLLYRYRLGWLLGPRLLLLTHVGRTSGRTYHTVLEVVRRDPATGEVTVAAGWGPGTDWYRNVLHAGQAVITTGRRTTPVRVRALEASEAESVLAGYETRAPVPRPVVNSMLSRLLGWRYDGSPEARARAVQQLPMVAFRPAQRAGDRADPGP